jgi:RNA polymerase sigma factor (sigma-70 family)
MALAVEGAAAVHTGADAALVRAAQRGDPMALGELMELLLPYVGRICGPIALQDGADAAQEAMIKILRGIGELREPAALFGWVRVIAVREAVKFASRSLPRQATDVADLSTPGDPQLGVDIADTLARLTPEHRAVLVLRDLEGLDEMEASRMLAVQPGTVRSRLFRARVSFRKAWRDD